MTTEEKKIALIRHIMKLDDVRIHVTRSPDGSGYLLDFENLSWETLNKLSEKFGLSGS